MEKVIVLNNVCKKYKLYKNDKNRLLGMFLKKIKHVEKEVLKDVSFEINKGESVALFGKNGAGKSTILKIITGVCYPNSGEVKVKGRVSALLELTAGFNPEFTGRENIFFKCSILGLKQREIKDLEQIIIDFSELKEYIDQPVRTYSSGMKARLGFSISVMVKPQILIVDEALSVGDFDFRNKCLGKVKELMKDKNVTLLFVTHSTKTALQFCQRGILLKDGQIVADSNIEDIIKLYENI